MPRRRSISIESVRVVPASTLPSSEMAPASNSSRSVRLVLPASTCARIPRLSMRTGQLLQESGRDCRQGSCRTHHRYLLESRSRTTHYHPARRPSATHFPRPRYRWPASPLLAPALLRSQVLSLLYQAVRRDEMTRMEAER